MLEKSSANEVAKAIAAIDALREGQVLVHCITNSVAQQFTANVLLACRANASMTLSPAEVPYFTARSDALLINLGTLDEARMEAMRISVQIAREKGLPVILDPVKCNLSPPRLAFASELIRSGGIILKANRKEREVLGDKTPDCLIVTGAVDEIHFDDAVMRVANGHPLMDQTIASGCALGALIAALNVVSPSPATAALAGLIWFGVAGEEAAKSAAGPGSFVPHFLDALANLDTDEISKRARVNE